MASCWSCFSQFCSSQSTEHSDIATYARANAEYLYYCAQSWWDTSLRYSRGESVTCECTEIQRESSLCECSFRDCQDYGELNTRLHGGSPCCGYSINQGPAPYGTHCFDCDYNGQSYEMSEPCWTDMHEHCNNSVGYTKMDDQEHIEDSQKDGVGTEEMEMEVNENFRKFLEQSKRYREERDKSKQANKESEEEVDYIEVGSVPVVATSRPPSEQQGLERKKAMKDLYGQQSEHIMSLETSLQLNYDRNCDIRRPIFWPNIPLKF